MTPPITGEVKASTASGKGGMRTGMLTRIRDALEADGVLFIDADDAIGPGVRLKLSPRSWA